MLADGLGFNNPHLLAAGLGCFDKSPVPGVTVVQTIVTRVFDTGETRTTVYPGEIIVGAQT